MRRGQKWVKLLFLTILVLLLGAFPLVTNANTINNSHLTAVRLVDDKGGLIKNVKLSARHAGSERVQDHGAAGENGAILLRLTPGRYYFTGDVSILNRRPGYGANFNDGNKVMFYYISEPVDVAEKTKEITLTINSSYYIDVADIAGAPNFGLHVNQDELGISININVHGSSDGVRLFLPVRKIYNLGNTEGVCHLKWPVYANPGTLVVISTI